MLRLCVQVAFQRELSPGYVSASAQGNTHPIVLYASPSDNIITKLKGRQTGVEAAQIPHFFLSAVNVLLESLDNQLTFTHNSHLFLLPNLLFCRR